MDLFVTCGSGLEPLLMEELCELGYKDTMAGFRGVYVGDSSMEAVYRINYNSRIAGRVLLPLLSFRCRDAKTLYRGAMEIDWDVYIPRGAKIAIDANVHNDSLTNSLFALQVVKDAICDQLREKRGVRPSVDVQDPDVQLNLFIRGEKAVISIDTSGAPLHKRGYRLETVEAPLQESLAAAMLRLVRYKGDEVVCDPCCGSGTVLIECAMIATATAPGYLRTKWGFQRLPGYSQEAFFKVKIDADAKRRPLKAGMIFGCDLGRNNSGVAKRNLRAAGFREVDVVQSDFRDFEPRTAPQFVMCNPPHGKRLGDIETLKSTYRALGDFMKRKSAKPGRGFVFTSSMDLAKEVGLAADKRHVISNSGVDSRLLEFNLY